MTKYFLIIVLLTFVIFGGGYFITRNKVSPIQSNDPSIQTAAGTGKSSQVKFSDTSESANAVQIFPSPLSDQAKQAMNGYQMQTKDMGDGSTLVTLIPVGQSDGSLQYTLQKGQTLYFIEKYSADDKSSADYNLEDDRAVIVDSQGYVVM